MTPTPEALKLALLLLEAASRHNHSFDTQASDVAAEKAAQDVKAAEERGEERPFMFGLVDHTVYYRLSLDEAARLACRNAPEMAYMVSMMLFTAWNDSLWWAEKVSGMKTKDTVFAYDPQEIVPPEFQFPGEPNLDYPIDAMMAEEIKDE